MQINRSMRGGLAGLLPAATCLAALVGVASVWAMPRNARHDTTPIAGEPTREVDSAVARRAVSAAGGGTFVDTGADLCSDAAVITLTVGPPGSPITTTVFGDNTPATGPDCSLFGSDPVWWEVFELTECATVTIDFCGTAPVLDPTYNALFTTCPTDTTFCGPPLTRSFGGQGAPVCGDNNLWNTWVNLEPGVYYFPVFSDESELVNGRGPYELHFSAEGCTGACCDFDSATCSEGGGVQDCSGPNQSFHPGESCCQTECLPPGEDFASSGVELLSQVPLSAFSAGGGNDAWGYISPSGREYGIIGLFDGTGFVEITDPFNPTVVGVIGDANSLWSDMKTYQQYAYNVNEAGGGMQIIDLSQIDDGIMTLTGALMDSGLQTSHNLALNTDSGFAYLCSTNIGGFIAVDLSDPADPVLAGGWFEAFAHDALIISYDEGPFAGSEIAFIFGGGDKFYIVDVTDKANMFTRSSVPGITTFGHQGWITEDRRYIIFGDEGQNFFTTSHVVNVEDLDNPFFVTDFGSGACTIDHNQEIRGPHSYQANYTSGLHVFDVSDPTNAQQVAFFDTHPENNAFGFDGAWGVHTGFPSGVVVTSDMQRGLFVLNYDCNDNGVDDTDDITLGTSDDSNLNGLPDECECGATIAAEPEPDGVAKNRYLSFKPNNGPRPMALRVKLVDVNGFGGFNGEFRWAGPPELQPGIDGEGDILVSKLQCDPAVADWSTAAVVHIYGAELVPGSTYELQSVHEACLDDGGFTTAVEILTSEWGDVVAPFGGVSQPNFGDISGVVDAFRSVPGAPSKTRAQLQPNVPNPSAPISFADISLTVDAFRGFAYPHSGPTACP